MPAILGRRTLAALLDRQASVLRAQLPGLYDGHLGAVHDARVATRRIRELLALVPTVPGRDGEGDVARGFRDAGRALGKVRDIDVQIALLRDLETHAPQTAPSLVLVRQDHERDRLAKMRRLIKTLERVDVEALIGTVSARHPTALRTRLTSGAWREQLRHLLLERARHAAERIARATGVYFPNRSHHARIAIKQLRYAAEIGEAIGMPDLAPAIKSLRKGQEILGDLHDRQSLAETLAGYSGRDGVRTEHLGLIAHVLEGEILDRHVQYLDRRDALRDACADVERAAVSSSSRGPAVAVGGALVVSGLALARRRWPRTG